MISHKITTIKPSVINILYHNSYQDKSQSFQLLSQFQVIYGFTFKQQKRMEMHMVPSCPTINNALWRSNQDPKDRMGEAVRFETENNLFDTR